MHADQEKPQADGADSDWLSLHEASELLGVALSTLRRWGDTGRVPFKRTLGGHRRFQRSAILQLLSAPPADPAPPEGEWGVDEGELARQTWHAGFSAGPHTDRMRVLGQRLLGLLTQYANRRDGGERFLQEAREISQSYGQESRAAGVTMYATVEAFLFFRRSFAQVGAGHGPAPEAALHERLDRFMDTILLGTIAGYEGGAGAPAQ